MKRIQPNKKEIVAWNSIAMGAGLVGGDTAYVYAAMFMFIIYSLLSLVYEFKEHKASRLNYFIIGTFAIINFQIAGPTGLSLTVMSAINMYLTFYLIMPLAQSARLKHKATYSKTTTGENHE
jgi:hypothetical protein